jgi:hypothetical protein
MSYSNSFPSRKRRKRKSRETQQNHSQLTQLSVESSILSNARVTEFLAKRFSSSPSFNSFVSSSSSDSSSDSDFLLTADEKREKRAKQSNQQTNSNNSYKQIPGFVYDDSTGKYFRFNSKFPHEPTVQRQMKQRTNEQEKAQQSTQFQPAGLFSFLSARSLGSSFSSTSSVFSRPEFYLNRLMKILPWNMNIEKTMKFHLSTFEMSGECGIHYEQHGQTLVVAGNKTIQQGDVGRQRREVSSSSSFLSSASSDSLEDFGLFSSNNSSVGFYYLSEAQLNQEKEIDEELTETLNRSLALDNQPCKALPLRPRFQSLIRHKINLNSSVTSVQTRWIPYSSFDSSVNSTGSSLIALTLLGGEHNPGTLQLFDLTGRSICQWQPKFGSLFCTSIAPDISSASSPRLATGGTKGAHLLDLDSMKRRGIWTAKSDVLALDWLSENELAVGCRDGSIRRFDQRRKENGEILLKSDSPIGAFQGLSGGERRLIFATLGGKLEQIDLRSPQLPLVHYHGHVNQYHRIQLCCDSSKSLLFAGGSDGQLRSWSVQTGQLINQQTPFSDLRSESGNPIVCQTLQWLNNFDSLLVGSSHGIAVMASR